MDLRQLTYFIEVAKYKSFTKASQTLHLSQPTISKMVKGLEDELGIELFDRSARQIELTDTGEIVYEKGKVILESLNKLSTDLYDLTNLNKGKIHIGIPPVIGFLFFPRIIKFFNDMYPNINIRMSEFGANRVEEEVKDGLLDLGVVVLPVDQEEFEIVPFVCEDMMLFVHSSHPFSEKKQVEMKDLKKESFILFREDFALHDRIIQECVMAGFQPNIAYESSQWDFISGMIAENLGVSIFPHSISKKIEHIGIKAIPIVNPSVPWRLGIILKKGRYVSHATREFIKNITQFQKH
ncbi:MULTISPECIES: LysR family transcriptional regulator [unclassified Bacillus (in: firmicutes)]|uniref:LysR family transcriptional regulator n=1 Tax=unclassified Bacillus (in: firmicutes) TaxID=185979 RepID=UPI0008E3273C|nr:MULTISPECIES: LysR family transcriptional regulator [unclassified Bacillus (in: firmicutes)]SFB02606.1 DNA-binding transcriptional regulator, LysR family [Bacillus sp. UNCCL13]SFQ89040.1 DNA-binding transcriptional regulator, LysR family [Bacillus sp. cl95]